MTAHEPPAKRASTRTRLHRTLIDEVDGKRTCLIVLGDGVNQQAEGRKSKTPSAWHQVLNTLWEQAGGDSADFPRAGQSSAAAWAMVVDQWASRGRVSAQSAERAVRKRASVLLAPLESAARRRQLYGRLLDGRLANVVSFSVDRRLVLQSGARAVVTRNPRATVLERHLEVTGSRGMTRVWFPYGDTSRSSSTELGYSGFDERLMRLEQLRASLMDTFNDHHYGYGPGLRPPTYIYERRWHAPNDWSELVLCAPLAIVGASLPVDDWPLWWLLHQRARYFVAFKDSEIAETFYLTSRPLEAGHVANGSAGIETVVFSTDDELWRFVLDALAAPGRDLQAGLGRHYGPRTRGHTSKTTGRARKGPTRS